jgi:hypothetical protein
MSFDAGLSAVDQVFRRVRDIPSRIVHCALYLLHFAFCLEFRIAGGAPRSFLGLADKAVDCTLCVLLIHVSPLSWLDAIRRKEWFHSKGFLILLTGFRLFRRYPIPRALLSGHSDEKARCEDWMLINDKVLLQRLETCSVSLSVCPQNYCHPKIGR